MPLGRYIRLATKLQFLDLNIQAGRNYFFEALENCNGALPVYSLLTTLKLAISSCQDFQPTWNRLSKFLASIPNLQVLVLELYRHFGKFSAPFFLQSKRLTKFTLHIPYYDFSEQFFFWREHATTPGIKAIKL